MILNYLGSKARVLPMIDKVVSPHLNKSNSTFGDLFAGTGVVSNHFKRKSKNVISSDLETYSYVLTYALLKVSYTHKLQKIIVYLNSGYCKPKRGLIWRSFAPNDQCRRMFFTPENASKIDAIRIALTTLYNSKLITYDEFIFLLASLLYSTSRFANTACTFRAYLKRFSPRALKMFTLTPIHQNSNCGNCNIVKKHDALFVAKSYKFDVVYLDPPYNANHYGSYYSFFNYLCLYDKNVEITGVAGVTKKYNKSVFGFKSTALAAFQRIIDSIDAKKIVVSYNSSGIMKMCDMKSILLSKGDVCLYKSWSRNYRPHKNTRLKHIQEYLFVVTPMPAVSNLSHVFSVVNIQQRQRQRNGGS